MNPHDVDPDPPLSEEQLKIVEALSDEQVAEIDSALLNNCTERWRKVAFVVALAMRHRAAEAFDSVPDVYYAERIGQLVEQGALEAAGNLRRMRYSEVRLPRVR